MALNDSQIPAAHNGLDPRRLTFIAYGLFTAGFISGGLLGIATLAAMVLLYVKRADVGGTFYSAHFDWLLRTFWWALLWLGLSFLTTLIYIGWIGIGVTLIWVLYRLVKGWLALFEGRAPTAYM
jgi:uncharacterized membrane protein